MPGLYHHMHTNLFSPNFHQSETSLLQEFMPLLIRSFHAGKRHHVQILQRHSPCRALPWDQSIGDQDPTLIGHGQNRIP